MLMYVEGCFLNTATYPNVDWSSAPIIRSFRPKLVIQETLLPVTYFRVHLNWCGQSEDSANALDDARQWILTKPATIAGDLPTECFGCSGLPYVDRIYWHVCSTKSAASSVRRRSASSRKWTKPFDIIISMLTIKMFNYSYDKNERLIFIVFFRFFNYALKIGREKLISFISNNCRNEPQFLTI